MAIIDIERLIRPVSRDDALADIIALAQGMGLRASSWRVGSRSRFWIIALAEVASRVSTQIALQTAGGFNGSSWGNMLTKLARSRFANDRTAAIKTQGTILLTDAGGTGPYNFSAGAYVFTYSQDPSITYRNVTGGTLPVSGTLELTIEAETGGEAHNVAVDTITTINPAIAGVTVTNRIVATPYEWVTRLGVEEEPDATLRARDVAKWSTLGGNAPAAAYEYWALTATQNADGSGDPVGITRAYVDATNAAGAGTLTVYVADSTGTASAAQVTDVQDYVNARKPPTSVPTVTAATEVLVNVTGIYYVRAGHATAASPAILAALTAYINGLPIGGTTLGSAGRVVWAELVSAVMHVEHVLSVSFTSPSADVALSPGQVAVLGAYAMTAVEV